MASCCWGVKRKVSQIREVEFDGLGMVVQGATTLSVAELRQLTISGCLGDVQRIQFFLLLLFTEGTGEHMVDFVSHPVRPNTLLLVKPGQVQQFCLNPSLEGQLIVIDPFFLRTEPAAITARRWRVVADVHRAFGRPGPKVPRHRRRHLGGQPGLRGKSHSPSTAAASAPYPLLRLRLYTEGDVPSAAPGKAYSLVTRFKELAEKEYLLTNLFPITRSVWDVRRRL